MKRMAGAATLFLLAMVLSVSAVHAQKSLWNDMVGWWRMNEVSGNIAYDTSGQDNHATLAGDVAFSFDANMNGGVEFTGANGMIIAPYVPAFDAPTGTLQVWVNVPVLHDADVFFRPTMRLVRREVDCGCGLYGLHVRADGSVRGYIANDDPNAEGPWTILTSGPGAISAGRWHQLVLRWDGSNAALIVDAKLRAQSSYTPVPGMGLSYSGAFPIYFGAASNWPGQGNREFLGKMAEIRFYARARSNGDIQSEYSNQTQTFKKLTTTTVRSWNFRFYIRAWVR